MVILWIILLVVFLLLVFVLSSPWVLVIDSAAGNFFLRWRGVASVRLAGTAVDPVARLWLLGWRKDIHLLEVSFRAGKKKKKTATRTGTQKGAWKRPRWLNLRFASRLLRTFRVHRFRLQLDTGDFARNAYWFPLFRALSKGNRQLFINFQGHNELQVHITNRLGSVAWAFLSQILSPKK